MSGKANGGRTHRGALATVRWQFREKSGGDGCSVLLKRRSRGGRGGGRGSDVGGHATAEGTWGPDPDRRAVPRPAGAQPR
jgi:hypothetical protein